MRACTLVVCGTALLIAYAITGDWETGATAGLLIGLGIIGMGLSV